MGCIPCDGVGLSLGLSPRFTNYKLQYGSTRNKRRASHHPQRDKEAHILLRETSGKRQGANRQNRRAIVGVVATKASHSTTRSQGSTRSVTEIKIKEPRIKVIGVLGNQILFSSMQRPSVTRVYHFQCTQHGDAAATQLGNAITRGHLLKGIQVMESPPIGVLGFAIGQALYSQCLGCELQ